MVPGPRIVPATYAIGATGGHCDATQFPPSVSVPRPAVANGPEEIRATVRKLRKYGAEVIKFCGTGGVLSKTDTAGGQQYSLEEMKALVDEAHALRLKAAAHCHGVEAGKRHEIPESVARVEQRYLGAAAAQFGGVQVGRDVALDHSDSDLAGEFVEGGLQDRRLARTGGAHQVDRTNSAVLKRFSIKAGPDVVLGEDRLEHVDPLGAGVIAAVIAVVVGMGAVVIAVLVGM